MKNTSIEKIRIFLEVVRVLNKYEIIPILYGSLGLFRVLGEFERKINDIDILLPDKFLIGKKWTQLHRVVTELGFVLKDKSEHEFVKNGEIVAFGKASDLIKLAGIDFERLKETNQNGARFRELSPDQYLNCYKFMLRDNYRQEKRGNADKEKIELIEKYLQ